MSLDFRRGTGKNPAFDSRDSYHPHTSGCGSKIVGGGPGPRWQTGRCSGADERLVFPSSSDWPSIYLAHLRGNMRSTKRMILGLSRDFDAVGELLPNDASLGQVGVPVPSKEPHPRPLPHGERGDCCGRFAASSQAPISAQVTPLPVGEGPGVGFLGNNSPTVSRRPRSQAQN